MIIDQNYQNKVEKFVIEISKGYIHRKSIYDPLSNILPYYWNSIFLTAVKHVMFKRVHVIAAAQTESKLKLVWVVINPARGATQIAKDIIEYEHILREVIWRKNGWGNPYRQCNKPIVAKPSGFEYKKVTEGGSIFLVSLMDFKRKYTEKLIRLGLSDTATDALLESIYKTIHDSFDTGVTEGIKAAKQTQSTYQSGPLIDIYNKLELEVNNLKKIIDKV